MRIILNLQDSITWGPMQLLSLYVLPCIICLLQRCNLERIYWPIGFYFVSEIVSCTEYKEQLPDELSPYFDDCRHSYSPPSVELCSIILCRWDCCGLHPWSFQFFSFLVRHQDCPLPFRWHKGSTSVARTRYFGLWAKPKAYRQCIYIIWSHWRTREICHSETWVEELPSCGSFYGMYHGSGPCCTLPWESEVYHVDCTRLPPW